MQCLHCYRLWGTIRILHHCLRHWSFLCTCNICAEKEQGDLTLRQVPQMISQLTYLLWYACMKLVIILSVWELDIPLYDTKSWSKFFTKSTSKYGALDGSVHVSHGLAWYVTRNVANCLILFALTSSKMCKFRWSYRKQNQAFLIIPVYHAKPWLACSDPSIAPYFDLLWVKNLDHDLVS